MHTTTTHLQSAIRTALNRAPVFRIYEDSLAACWPNRTPEARMLALEQFANQNHWTVRVRQLGGVGVAAEFEKLAA